MSLAMSGEVDDYIVMDEKIVTVSANGDRACWRLVPSITDNSILIWKPYLVSKNNEIITKPAWLPLPGSQSLFLSCPIGEVLYEGTRGPGKALLNSEFILTNSGWKKVCEVSMLDKLVAVDGTYTEILGVYPQKGFRKIYRVTFDDDATLDVDGDHLWTVYDGTNGWRDGWVVRDTKSLKIRIDAAEQEGRKKNHWSIPTMSAPAPGLRWCGLDPYVIGLTLGDGTTGSDYATIYTADEWIRDSMVLNHGWRPYKYDGQVGRVSETRGALSNAWKDAVGRAKAADKRVPTALLDADSAARLAVLQGLMDSDGSIEKTGQCRFTSLSFHLAHDVQYLVRSLGGKATCYWEDRPSPKGGVDGRWRVNVQHCNKFNPFKLPRKADRWKPMEGTNRRIVSIVEVGDGSVTCFEVAHPSHLFVCQDFIVTHNTISLLLDFAREIGKGWGKAWRGILFRRELGDLDDVVRKIEDFFPTIWGDNGVWFRRAKGDYSCVWSTGEELLLRNLAGVEDYDQYHGHEYPWIGFEELTQWENDDAYMLMHSCSRPTRPGIPCRIRATTNPYGPGHNWVKKRFQLPHMRNKIVRQPGELPRIAIHGSLRENFLVLSSTRMEGLPYNPDRIYEDSKYPIQIRNAASNDAQAQAWLTGDWNVTAGGMIDDVWNAAIHVIPNFQINQVPHGWTLTRSYDHGQSHPFAVGWFLQSNGEPIKINGIEYGRKKGDLILWAEWYGVTKNANEGLRMPASIIAQGILDREDDMGVKGRVVPGPADTEIWSKDNRGMNRSPADDMEQVGVLWERADKGAGSRKRGYELLRTMLMGAIPGPDGTRDKPGFFVCSRCLHWIEIVPPTPRDPKNLDDSPLSYEDHLADMTRYRLSWSVPETWVRGF